MRKQSLRVLDNCTETKEDLDYWYIDPSQKYPKRVQDGLSPSTAFGTFRSMFEFQLRRKSAVPMVVPLEMKRP